MRAGTGLGVLEVRLPSGGTAFVKVISGTTGKSWGVCGQNFDVPYVFLQPTTRLQLWLALCVQCSGNEFLSRPSRLF